MKVVILAGGSGSRLWPSSRKSLPKQFLRFGDRDTLFQMTVKRFLKKFPWHDCFILTQQEYGETIDKQLEEIDPRLKANVLIEPASRNTAPALAVAMKYFLSTLELSKEESILVAPSDHVMHPEENFTSILEQADEEAKRGSMVAFGICPKTPETGYGYIKTANNERKILQFIEKPNLETAQQFIKDSCYLWNSGLFLFTIQTFIQELHTHCPAIALFFKEGGLQDYADLPHISIDYALMEKTTRGVVFALDLSWSDIGSWDSVYEILEKDENRNVKIGHVLDIDTKNCLIVGSKRLISTIGLEDMLIVETEDVIFLSKKGESQKVKQLVEALKENRKEYL